MITVSKLSMAALTELVEWRSALMVYGALCAAIAGMTVMPLWPADS